MKKKYSKPKLEKHGTLEQQTQSGNAVFNPDGSTGSS